MEVMGHGAWRAWYHGVAGAGEVWGLGPEACLGPGPGVWGLGLELGPGCGLGDLGAMGPCGFMGANRVWAC